MRAWARAIREQYGEEGATWPREVRWGARLGESLSNWRRRVGLRKAVDAQAQLRVAAEEACDMLLRS